MNPRAFRNSIASLVSVAKSKRHGNSRLFLPKSATKIGGVASKMVTEAWIFGGLSLQSSRRLTDLHGGIAVRMTYPKQTRFDCPAIDAVELNLKCRDEIIPILRALQHVYADDQLLDDILAAVGKDVNQNRRRKVGRQGLDY